MIRFLIEGFFFFFKILVIWKIDIKKVFFFCENEFIFYFCYLWFIEDFILWLVKEVVFNIYNIVYLYLDDVNKNV